MAITGQKQPVPALGNTHPAEPTSDDSGDPKPRLNEVAMDERERKATKADDAEVPVELWTSDVYYRQ